MSRRILVLGTAVVGAVALAACSSSTTRVTAPVATDVATTLVAPSTLATLPAPRTTTPVSTAAATASTSVAVPAGTTATTIAPAAGVTSALVATRLPKRSRVAAVADGSTILVAGGLDSGGSSVSTVLRLDPATGEVTPAGQLALAVHDSGAAILGGSLVVFAGGGSSGERSTVQSGAPGADLARTANLPAKRADHTVVSDGTRAFIVGGFDGTDPALDVLATTDGTSFTVVGHLAHGTRYPAVALVGTRIIVIGGSLNKQSLDTVQALDIATGATTELAPLPEPRTEATALVLAGSIFLAGGRTPAGVSDAVLRIDPSSGAATPAGTLPTPLADAGGVVVNGTGYLVGGEASGRTATVISLTP